MKDASWFIELSFIFCINKWSTNIYKQLHICTYIFRYILLHLLPWVQKIDNNYLKCNYWYVDCSSKKRFIKEVLIGADYNNLFL